MFNFQHKGNEVIPELLLLYYFSFNSKNIPAHSCLRDTLYIYIYIFIDNQANEKQNWIILKRSSTSAVVLENTFFNGIIFLGNVQKGSFLIVTLYSGVFRMCGGMLIYERNWMLKSAIELSVN